MVNSAVFAGVDQVVARGLRAAAGSTVRNWQVHSWVAAGSWWSIAPAQQTRGHLRARRIVGLPVSDNQFVHKGDVLLSVEAGDYAIAVEQAQATLDQAHARPRMPHLKRGGGGS
jgi:hypothetical protein